MLPNPIITCAVTGNITTVKQNPHLPVTPEQIATAVLEAAEEGAAIAHVHVRDPSGMPSMETEYYRDVMDRVRRRNRDVILNLTTGPGGRFVPSDDDPRVAGPGTTLMPPEKRVEHIEILKPDVCTLDLNTMNSGEQVVINTPKNVIRMARRIRAAGVKPEIELFDSGDVHLARHLIRQGELEGPGMFSLVLGVRYGFDATPATMAYARSLLPPGAVWTGFGIGRAALPMVAQSWLLGGHVRIGMEDTVYLSKGELAPSNAALVRKARDLLMNLGATPATTGAARRIIGIA
jgi:3-dehydrocarnitine:acetyl-CoA trimethylamine transferase